MFDFYMAILILAFGACIGSFLNVCIYRIPRDESIVFQASHCTACGCPIAWHDNIPLIGYIALRGKCRSCNRSISPRYVVVECLTAMIYLLMWWAYGYDIRTVIYWLMAGGLILGTFLDLEHMIIPDRVTWGGICTGLICSGAFPALHGVSTCSVGLLRSGTGAMAGFGLLWGVGVLGKMAFKKDAMGFGDVKLLAAIGAFLGWQAVIFTVMISSLIGSLAGVGLIVAGGKKWQSRIPFGPDLAAGALIWTLWGIHWWEAYVRWALTNS